MMGGNMYGYGLDDRPALLVEWSPTSDGSDDFTRISCLRQIFSLGNVDEIPNAQDHSKIPVDIIAYGTMSSFGIVALLESGETWNIVPVLHQLCGSKVTALSWSLDSRLEFEPDGRFRINSM
jgi:hypothetical protein